jgi:hypothetical protein
MGRCVLLLSMQYCTTGIASFVIIFVIIIILQIM